jgi:hypothetical protein
MEPSPYRVNGYSAGKTICGHGPLANTKSTLRSGGSAATLPPLLFEKVGLHSRSSVYGGMPRAIGLGHTNRHSRTKAPRAVGCTHICIARKVIRATRRTGTVRQKSPFAENRWIWNGLVS